MPLYLLNEILLEFVQNLIARISRYDEEPISYADITPIVSLFNKASQEIQNTVRNQLNNLILTTLNSLQYLDYDYIPGLLPILANQEIAQKIFENSFSDCSISNLNVLPHLETEWLNNYIEAQMTKDFTPGLVIHDATFFSPYLGALPFLEESKCQKIITLFLNHLNTMTYIEGNHLIAAACYLGNDDASFFLLRQKSENILNKAISVKMEMMHQCHQYYRNDIVEPVTSFQKNIIDGLERNNKTASFLNKKRPEKETAYQAFLQKLEAAKYLPSKSKVQHEIDLFLNERINGPYSKTNKKALLAPCSTILFFLPKEPKPKLTEELESFLGWLGNN